MTRIRQAARLRGWLRRLRAVDAAALRKAGVRVRAPQRSTPAAAAKQLALATSVRRRRSASQCCTWYRG